MYCIHFLDKATTKLVYNKYKYKHKSLKAFLDESYEPNIEALDTCAAVVLTDIHMKSMYEARTVAKLLKQKLRNALPGYFLEVKVYEQVTNYDNFVKEGIKYYLIQAFYLQIQCED